MNANKNKTIYSITTEDLQKVAEIELNRFLSKEEINCIAKEIGDRINWYDIIYELIFEKIEK